MSLKVYDMLGCVVATLVNAEQASGEYEVNYHPENLSSGIYFYTLKAGNYQMTRKLLLLR